VDAIYASQELSDFDKSYSIVAGLHFQAGGVDKFIHSGRSIS
jgi:hypothetical protein